ncbi:MAG: efflux RND transporter periplasmic adaptor subunit [Gammaproteobacteria bacterium]|nr:efflux RND transporter periplasmic adaptor subunit [Gammaproteobacteria bacterium]
MVLSPQALTDLRNRYVAAAALADKAVAALAASRREYERLKALHGDDRNISDKALQAAEAAWRSDQAAERSAQAAVNAIRQESRQTWGAVLTAAIVNDMPLFQRLAMQKEMLLRIAAPSGSRLPVPPGKVSVAGDDGVLRTAELISPSPQTDPRIQGPAFFYAAAAEGLLPGTTLTARLPIGPQETGVTIPAAAVVSWQGKMWYYVESAPGRFVRHELTGAVPVAGGWFAPRLAAMRIVVRGAQTLLSEELRGQVQTGEGD